MQDVREDDEREPDTTKPGQEFGKVEKLMNEALWKFSHCRTGAPKEVALEAEWEVMDSPITDEYTPLEMSAEDLLREWSNRVKTDEKCESLLVPIYWSVRSPGGEVHERMPFQHSVSLQGNTPGDDFLKHYTWPVNSRTGQRLNWLVLPVADKEWNDHQSDKGGFIQEVTGWKPSVLQPAVHLLALMSVLDAK